MQNKGKNFEKKCQEHLLICVKLTIRICMSVMLIKEPLKFTIKIFGETLFNTLLIGSISLEVFLL
jgi:hypothetical protein